MPDLKDAGEVTGKTEQERNARGIGEEDGRADAPLRARDPIGNSATGKQRQRDDRADGREADAIRDPAEMVQFTLRQSAIGEIDTEEVRDRQAASQRRRPDGDRCEQEHDRERQPDIGDQAARHDRNPGQEIAEAGRDQVVGVIPDVTDRRRVADLAGGHRCPGRSLAEHETACYSHGRAEGGADVAAARHGGEIIDPFDQTVMVQRLEHAKAHGRGADAAAGQGEPDDIEHLAGVYALGVELPGLAAARVDRRDLVANDLLMLFAPGPFLV